MDTFDGECLQKMVRGALLALEREKARINGLNVFPVPDGDTGTNMALTLRAAVEGPGSKSLHEYAQRLADLSLRGARGNSGTILSQFMQGFSLGVRGLSTAGPMEIAQAIQQAADTAYDAVAVPQEGTMLTVGRYAAMAAHEAATSGADVERVFEAALKGAAQALEKTPDLLPVLKEAGVVDAGGEGLVVCLAAGIRALRSDTMDELLEEFDEVSAIEETFLHGDSHSHFAIHPTDINFKYCTEFLVIGEQIDLDDLKARLEPLGDSLIVVGSPSLAKVHVHTDMPGQALDIGCAWGDLSGVSVANMQEQNRQTVESAQAVNTRTAKTRTAVVAVSFGDGLQAIMESFGVAEVVPATTSLKPSAGQLHEAIERAVADQIILLPSHKDVVLAAEQATKLSGKRVAVLGVCNPLVAIHALLQYDPEADFEQNVRRMEESIDEIGVAEVTQAARATTFQGVSIREGDYFALVGEKIITAGSEVLAVVQAAVEALEPEEGALITLYYGQGISSEMARQHLDRLQEMFGASYELEMYSGGQSAYDYWISVE